MEPNTIITKLEETNTRFKELQDKRNDMIHEINVMYEEMLRLQGAYRVLDEMLREVEKTR